ncbi:hypothetical protein [Prolixibacter sp. SD074]|uniref:hypothetical protein n=1 Tax=Prolixibacter sp. SD074 TaxID=2652391 RepID=UPI001285C0D0|nr:hypothetical protein [Prolixibacter sp. SD074]GET29742.1 hypothetical protein SD074_19440 [Prolixibacter sp. SD074]
METIINLAGGVNWGISTKNNTLFLDSATQLYNYMQQKGAYLLTQIEESGELQMIGKAFSYFARFLDNEDPDINSVAEENAFYCLSKSIKLDNYFAGPELYNLISGYSELLMDKFIAVRMSELQETKGIPVNLVYGNPYMNSKARIEAKKIIPFLKFYVRSTFFDIKMNKPRMPSDLIEYSLNKVVAYIESIYQYSSFDEGINIGGRYFEKVYSEMEDTLLEF